MAFARIFYAIKPVMPRILQLSLRRHFIIKSRQTQYVDIWPIDKSAGKARDHFAGWPDGKRFALILTHDVDGARGQKKCTDLFELEQSLSFQSSFNFVPERYRVDPSIRTELAGNGFEVGVHGLNHDGKLYQSQRIFQERAQRINDYLKTWNAVGFRSPAMHHNLDWIHDLDIDYDASTFDTDPFEPQPNGVGTIFPFWVSKDSTKKGYVELPYTLPQDFTLFILMKEKNINIWKKKIDWISKKGGMALVNTHPDYMKFDDGKLGIEEYPARYYQEFLEYIKGRYEGQYWHVLPKEMARFWKENAESTEG
jgi:peptidoglycan/xylan/chitin deacetylase (PgdA/CDA1 family)